MQAEIFNSILSTSTTASFNISGIFWCTLGSLLFGAVIALVYGFRNHASKSFVITLALLPAIVQLVITLVNGNLGTGVAVMGAFSLVRFRSVPGTAKEICCIFLAMAVGLATGMGYLVWAAVFTVILCGALIVYTILPFGESKQAEKDLKITIPEGLDYSGVFDDLMSKYTSKWCLLEVRTCNMGSLYKLHYRILLKDRGKEKEFIDGLRCRNGNLEISCGRISTGIEAL